MSPGTADLDEVNTVVVAKRRALSSLDQLGSGVYSGDSLPSGPTGRGAKCAVLDG